jgi:hypothetical protein
MKTNYKFNFIVFFLIAFVSFSQNGKLTNPIILDSIKVNMFVKYPQFKHDLQPGGFYQWKNDNPLLYQKEMWYYTESFYIKRNYLPQGITLNESAIDITRFESQRQAVAETTITLDGFKDVLVLIPGNDLIYKPN